MDEKIVDLNPQFLHKKCVTCDRLGKDCFPNLYRASTNGIRIWARERLQHLDWSYTELAEKAHVPVSTLTSSFSKSGDIYYTTFAPTLCALIGGDEEETPCPPLKEDVDRLKETIRRLAHENGILKKESDSLKHENKDLREELKIKTTHLEWENETLKGKVLRADDLRREDIQAAKDEEQKKIDYLKTLVKKLFTIVIIASCISILFVVLDRMNPDFGVIWSRAPLDTKHRIMVTIYIVFATAFITSFVSWLFHRRKDQKKNKDISKKK